MPVQKEYDRYLMPLVTGFSTLLLGKTLLELTTQGAIYAPYPMADAYLFVMATYAGAGEWEKWKKPGPWDPADDPWLERAHRGGIFLWLWSIPFFGAYCWGLHNPAAVFPAELKPIWMGLFGIFLAKNTSRSIRHGQHGLYPTWDADPGFSDTGTSPALSELAQQILAYLQTRPNHEASTRDISAQCPKITNRHIRRVLTALHDQLYLERTSQPGSAEALYRLTPAAEKAAPLRRAG